MTRLLAFTSIWSIKHRYFLLIYLIYTSTFFCSIIALPTSPKVPCTDGCKHIHLTLGADNHLIPQWTFLPAYDTPEGVLSVEMRDYLAPDEHQILELNIGNHVVPRYEVRDQLKHKILMFSTENHLVSIQDDIHPRDQVGQVLSLNIENQLVPLKRDVHDRGREALFIKTDSKILPTPHLARRGSVDSELLVGSEGHLASPKNKVDDGAEGFLLLSTESHLVRRNEPGIGPEHQIRILDIGGHLVWRRSVIPGNEVEDKAKPQVSATGTGSCIVIKHAVSRRQADHQYETGMTRFLDVSSHLVLPRNEFQDEADPSNVGDQPDFLRRIPRRAEPEDGAAAVTVVAEQKGPKSEQSVISAQSMAGPPLPPIMPPSNNFTVRGSRSYPTIHDPDNLTNTPLPSRRSPTSIPVPKFTVSAEETIVSQKTLYGGSMATFTHNLNSGFEYPPRIGCFNCVLRVAIGLSTLLTMISLLLLCCLSRKGQYIWINTINIADVQNPINKANRRPHYIRDNESNGTAGEGQNENLSMQDIESVNNSGAVSRQSVQNPTRLNLPGEWVAHGNDVESATASRPEIIQKNGPSLFKGWFNSNGQATVIRKPGVFQRLFGQRTEKHVNFNDTPLSGSKNSRKIHSNRNRNGEGPPDPSIILAGVAERLIGERMRQLSTILSVGEEEEAEAAIADPDGEETSSMSSIMAVATGSTMGTQGRNNTVRRNRPGASRAFNDTDNVAASLPIPATDNTSIHEETRAESLAGEGGSGSKGRSIRSVRFDESADKTEARVKGTSGRVSIGQYQFPETKDSLLVGEASCLEDTPISSNCGTIIKKERQKERIGGMWEDILQEIPSDLNIPVSANSTISKGTGAELERQPKGNAKVGDGGGDGGTGSDEIGSSIGDDSTLIIDSDENVEIAFVNSRPPTEEVHGSELREAAATPGFAMGSDLMLNQGVGTGFNVAMEEVISDECGVSAFGLRAKSPRWDSQTSNADSEFGGSELSSGYFTGTSSSNESMKHELGTDLFVHPADHIKRPMRVENEIVVSGALNAEPRMD